jgi:hypothetical protein
MAPSATVDYKRGGERLFETIAAACDPGADFAEQVRSTLDAALALLAAEPFPGGDSDAAEQRRWRGRCAGLLRRSARLRPGAGASPLFLEPLLIDGVCWRISDRLRSTGAEHLPALMPDLLECVLAYYFDPAEPGPDVAARAAG